MHKALDLAEFEEMGRKAFAEGRMAVPWGDPVFSARLRELTKGKPVGFAVDILDAWSRGWHRANVAASVPEMEQ